MPQCPIAGDANDPEDTQYSSTHVSLTHSRRVRQDCVLAPALLCTDCIMSTCLGTMGITVGSRGINSLANIMQMMLSCSPTTRVDGLRF